MFEVVRFRNVVMKGKNLAVIGRYAKKADVGMIANTDMKNAILTVRYGDGAVLKADFADPMVMLDFARKKHARGIFGKLTFEQDLTPEEVATAVWKTIHEGRFEQDREDKMVANIVYNQMNAMGSNGQRGEFLPVRMAYEHPTIQETFTRDVVWPFVKMVADRNSDMRNEDAVELCQFLKASVVEENRLRREDPTHINYGEPDIDYMRFI